MLVPLRSFFCFATVGGPVGGPFVRPLVAAAPGGGAAVAAAAAAAPGAADAGGGAEEDVLLFLDAAASRSRVSCSFFSRRRWLSRSFSRSHYSSSS